MHFFVFLVLQLSLFTNANPSTCLNLFKSSSTLLSPHEAEVLTLIHWPRTIKTQEQTLADFWRTLEIQRSFAQERPLFSDDFIQQLFLNENIRYLLPKNPEDLSTFVDNKLHFVASRLAWDWKEQELSQLIARPITHSTRFTLHAIIDSYFVVSRLNEHHPSIEYLKQMLQQKPWQSFPFKESQFILDEWNSVSSENTPNNFSRWIRESSHLPKIPNADLERLTQAIFRGKQNHSQMVLCCKAGFPCKQCPHNRFWLKTSKMDRT